VRLSSDPRPQRTRGRSRPFLMPLTAAHTVVLDTPRVSPLVSVGCFPSALVAEDDPTGEPAERKTCRVGG
jgi:hypothetical protein